MDLSLSKVNVHREAVRSRLKPLLPASVRDLYFEEVAGSAVAVNLGCSGFPSARCRKRSGQAVPVVPLFEPDENSRTYWLNFFEAWEVLASKGATSRRYVTNTLSVYYGADLELDKLQLFRAEWSGLDSAGGISSGSGHPHWHFDSPSAQLETAFLERERLREIAKTLDETFAVEEFATSEVSTAAVGLEPYKECLAALTRVHFAQAAFWWVKPWSGNPASTAQHSRGPESAGEVQNWITSVLSYVRHELGR